MAMSSIWNCFTHKDPLGCAGSHLSGAVANTAVPAAWDEICKTFVDAASQLLAAFGRSFAAIPDINPEDPGLSKAYAVTLSIAAAVAVLIVIVQIARTAITHDGKPLAQAATGVVKTVVVWMATASVATAALWASDDLTRLIVRRTFGSQANLAVRLGAAVNWAQVAQKPGQEAVGVSLLLILAIIGILLTAVLWLELLFRNAALGLLIVGSTIAAAGQISEKTETWWSRLIAAGAQLIILKPVIALVFMIGFSTAGNSSGIENVLAGILDLAMAAFSWPIIARFFTWTNIQAASSGLAMVLGFAAGRMSGGGAGAQSAPSGIDPRQWSQATEQQTATAPGGGGASGGGPGSGAPAGGGPAGPTGGPGGGSAGGGGGGSAVMAGIGAVLAAAHQTGTWLAGGMEQTAAHGGMPGAYPYSTVGNSGSRTASSRGRRFVPPPATSGPQGPQEPQSPEPQEPPDPTGPGDQPDPLDSQAPPDLRTPPPDWRTGPGERPDDPPDPRGEPPDPPDEPPDPPSFRPY